MENCEKYGVEAHHLFINFLDAFDSIDLSVPQKALIDFAAPKTLINFLKLTFTSNFSMVRMHGESSSSIEIVNDDRQKDALAYFFLP